MGTVRVIYSAQCWLDGPYCLIWPCCSFAVSVGQYDVCIMHRHAVMN